MKILRWLNMHFEPVLIVTAISLMTGLLCLQIVLRFFDATIPWIEELARYLFVWAMYLSISYCIKDNRHIRIRILVDKLPTEIREAVQIFSDLLFMFFSLIITFYSLKVIGRSLELGQIAPAMEIPIAVLYSSVLVGAALNVIRLSVCIYNRWQIIRQPKYNLIGS